MSFTDYGFDVFSFSPYNRRAAVQSCGDCCLLSKTASGTNLNGAWASSHFKNSYYHIIVDHLIDLGTLTENELIQARNELENYKRLRLTDEQINQLKQFEFKYKNEEVPTFVRNFKRDIRKRSFIGEDEIEIYETSPNTPSATSRTACTASGVSFADTEEPAVSTSDEPVEQRCCSSRAGAAKQTRSICTSCEEGSLPDHGAEWSAREAELCEEFRATIIQKESVIISLKTESAAKDADLRELREQNMKLDQIMENMKDDIKHLEKSSKTSQSQIRDIMCQKTDELANLHEKSQRLEQQLHEEHNIRKRGELEISKLENIVQESQILERNLSNELKLTRKSIESLEGSNASQAIVIKQLQQERDSFDKQIHQQEKEIEKLLDIVKRLNEKYECCKDDLATSERKVHECRGQLEAMEQEVGRLTVDLGDCLGRGSRRALRSAGDSRDGRRDVYEQARELAEDLGRIVREHEKCDEERSRLVEEIERLRAINRAYGEGHIRAIKISAHQEIAKLKKAIECAEHYREIKMELKNIVDDLVSQVDKKRIEKAEKVYENVANEAFLTLENLNKSIINHEVYKKCETFLLLVLGGLEEALGSAETMIYDIGIVSKENLPQVQVDLSNEEYEIEKMKFFEGNDNYAVIEQILSKKLLQRVQNSTQIIIRITAALQNDSVIKMANVKNLEEKLQKTLSVLNDVNTEKCRLESEYVDCQIKSDELARQIEQITAALTEKSSEMQTLNKNLQFRIECCQQENENLKKELAIVERKLRDSYTESSALTKKTNELIKNLQLKLEAKDVKLRSFGKFNDFVNEKLDESNQIIKQLRNALLQESMCKVDVESFTALHDRILELVKDKEQLTKKISVLESQLRNFEKNNLQLQSNLEEMLEDNQRLEKCIENFKSENSRLEMNIAKQDDCKNKISCQFDELLKKVVELNKNSQKEQRMSVAQNDNRVLSLEKEIISLKEKLRFQQKELIMNEKEIIEKNKNLEDLAEQLKNKENTVPESFTAILKQTDLLKRENLDLKDQLKQTLMKFENKLSEMHKQYNHNEIELHKNHNESIRKLEAKYIEMLKEEGKIFGSQNLIQSLNPNELQDLHDRICKAQLCNSMYSRDNFDEPKKRTMNKNSALNYAAKKALQTKKDVKSSKSSVTSVTKTNSVQRFLSSELFSNRSVIVPEKDNSYRTTHIRNDFK